MANVAHKNLTGTDLHEPKGCAAAAAGKVYVADGAGSGAWTVRGFEAQLYHVQNQQTSGTAGSSLTLASWNKVTLNTEVTDEITSSSLTSSVIALPAGTYFIEANATVYIGPGAGGGGFVAPRLRNTTANTTLIRGLSTGVANAGGDNTADLHGTQLSGRFTLSAPSNLEFQLYPNATGTVLLGYPTTTGENEVYADVRIWKIP